MLYKSKVADGPKTFEMSLKYHEVDEVTIKIRNYHCHTHGLVIDLLRKIASYNNRLFDH